MNTGVQVKIKTTQKREIESTGMSFSLVSMLVGIKGFLLHQSDKQEKH